MRILLLLNHSVIAFIAALFLSLSANAAEITVYTLDDTLEPLAKQFMVENPNDKINVEVVSYQSLTEALPIQLASGKGPDVSVVTDLGGLAKYYLDLSPYVDVDSFEKEFGETLKWLRGTVSPASAINGLPSSMTVNGGYVNETLFEQAGVPLPKEGATWNEWAEATRQVAKATETDFPMEMDRSGHRFASFAISEGAELVDEAGNPVIDEGLKRAITQFVAWHKDNTMPLDLWGAVGGAATRDNFADFINAKVVMYFGGSWRLRDMNEQVGDLFQWKVIETPCGASSCTAMPGGGAIVAFKHTKAPELAGKFINFLSSEQAMRQSIAQSVNIPSSTTLVKTGVKYPSVGAQVQAGLDTFIRQIPKMAPAAYRFQGWAFQRAMMNALTTRISQVINNEMDIDTALQRIKDDVDIAIAATKTE